LEHFSNSARVKDDRALASSSASPAAMMYGGLDWPQELAAALIAAA
jgi:hypothetical protein